jgi:molybdopterin/thiamine biosynthesis adenylyltransferase
VDIPDIPERFSRNIGAVSENEQERLGGARVFVAGCGGIGGYVIEHLVRMGIGHILCADNGQFEKTNLNRQILCDTQTLGHTKADAAVKRAALINPGADVRGVTANLANPANIKILLHNCDLAIDALDNAEARRALFDACEKQNIPVIHAAVRSWLVQAAYAPPGSGLYGLLYPEDTDNTDNTDNAKNTEPAHSGVLSFAPGMAASVQAAIAVRYLCGYACDSDLHVYNMRTMEYSRISV